MLKILVLLMLCVPLAAAQNKIYKTVDKDGNEIYTDTPPASETGAEEVDVRPINTVAPPPAIPRIVEPEKPVVAGAPTVAITSPADDSTIPMGPGDFSVSVSVDPAPQPGHRLQLKIDGENHGQPQTAGIWALTNVFRGAHTLTVDLLDSKGKTVSVSEPVTVYVQRPSVQFRRR